MKILESPLMGEFIAYLKSNWGGNSRVSQRRRRLRQLVSMVRGVADAAEGHRAALQGGSFNQWQQLLRTEALQGQAVLDATSDPSVVVSSARNVLAGIRTLFVCNAEVDRLKDAVEGLERLVGPGADLDLFLKVLLLDAAAAPNVEQGTYSVAVSAGADLPVPGAKRKRAGGGGGSSGVDQAEAGDGVETSHGRLVDSARYRHKRRALACKRRRSSGPPPESNSSWTVARAITRLRGRIGKPNLGPRFSLISLQG